MTRLQIKAIVLLTAALAAAAYAVQEGVRAQDRNQPGGCARCVCG